VSEWVLTLLSLLTLNLPAAEFTARWVGARDGAWSTPGNWDIGRVPNNTPVDTYDVVWDQHAVTVTLDQDTFIRDFTFSSGGRLQSQSSQTRLTVAGTFTWNQGLLALRNRTTVQGAATIQGLGANLRTLESGQLWLQGVTQLRSGLHLLNGARVVNDTAARFEAQDGARFSMGGNLVTDIVNLGIFRVFPGGQSFTSVQFRNEGFLDVRQRTLEFATPGASVDQRAGRTRLNDARVEGLLSIMAGTLEGSGFVREAVVLGRVSGKLTFNKLTPGNNATNVFAISDRPGEDSDRFSIETRLSLGGNLEIKVRAIPADGAALEVVSAPAGVSGQFRNVAFGQRVQVANTPGSFLLQMAPDSKSITLSDYRHTHLPPIPVDLRKLKRVQCTDCFMCLIFALFGIPEEPVALLIQRGLSQIGLASAGTSPASPSGSPAVFHALQSLLKTTTEGRRLVDLFWQHTTEVVTISLLHPEVLQQANLVVRSFEPGVAALLAGNGPGAVITQTMIDQLDLLWSLLDDHASPALRAVLQEERARSDGFQEFVNKDFSQWADLLQISTPTQPWIQLSSPTKSAGRFSVDVNNIPGLDYSLWRSANLVQWERVPFGEIQKGEFTTRLIDPNSPAQPAFYAVRP
jgi:hypothetical protein